MRTLNSDDFYTLSQASKILGMAVQTLWRYYDWWENPNFEKPDDPELQLPKIYYVRRTSRFIRKDEIDQITKFREVVKKKYPKLMAEYNAISAWGKTGKKILEKRGKTYKQEKSKLIYLG